MEFCLFHLSTYKASQGDGDYLLALQLSESDPHFARKKNLLETMGLESGLYFDDRSPDWTSTMLERLLQIARIIHMDEAELYFEGYEESTAKEYKSPRNELEALSAILSIIDTSLLSAKGNKVSLLTDLRKATVDMILNFGEKNKFQTKIGEERTLDKENDLIKWGESNGVKTKLRISYVEGAGRGAIAEEDLNIGDIALELPLSILITEDLVLGSDMYHILENIGGISPETMLLLWSMMEKHNISSKFKIYFDTLPEMFNTGLSFGIDALMTLDGTLLLDEIMQAKEHLRSKYEELVPSLCQNHPGIFPPELYTWEQFLWACELWYSNSMKIKFADGQLKTCLVPIAGFMNHSLYPHIRHYGKVDVTTNSLKFPLSMPCREGEQCYLNYGNFSSSHLVTFYGFLPEGDNPYDVLPLDIDPIQDELSEDGSLLSDWTTHMVRDTSFSKNHNIFYYGLPPPLLDFLRKAKSPDLFVEAKDPLVLETEMEVLEVLLSTFKDMMENLGNVDMDTSSTLGWDVTLAAKYKNVQRRIVSSILSSCSSGLELLTNELEKSKIEAVVSAAKQ